MRRILIPLLFSVTLCAAQEAVTPPIVSRKYHRATIADIAAGKVHHTHLEVQGWVTYVRREDDGDLHIRICNSPKVKTLNRARCLILECIPRMPCPAPDIGKKIAAHGIQRFDNEVNHLWYELHPVEEGFW